MLELSCLINGFGSVHCQAAVTLDSSAVGPSDGGACRTLYFNQATVLFVVFQCCIPASGTAANDTHQIS